MSFCGEVDKTVWMPMMLDLGKTIVEHLETIQKMEENSPKSFEELQADLDECMRLHDQDGMIAAMDGMIRYADSKIVASKRFRQEFQSKMKQLEGVILILDQ